MELRNLITFIHVAELGSFTKAAEQLGYSQSTISFQIKQLEDAPIYVDETAKLLGLDNVTAVEARAEDFAKLPEYREKFDYATARAVASLPMLCELTIPFVRVGGCLVAMKSKGVHEEFEASRSAIRPLAGANSLASTSLHERMLVGEINGEKIEENRTVVVMNKKSATPKTFPRKFAQIKKAPL